jgi:hypothetical protein
VSDLVKWLEHQDPLTLTAWATVVLAFVGVVSIVANFVLAWQARSSARAASAAVKLQQEEIGILKRQADLAEDQFKSLRDAARPRLRATKVQPGTHYIKGGIAYVHGSEPAYQIRIWIRGPSKPGVAGWGLYTSSLPFIGAADRELSYTAIPAEPDQQQVAEAQFPDFFRANVPPREYWIGLTWERLDRSTDKLAEKQTLITPWVA